MIKTCSGAAGALALLLFMTGPVAAEMPDQGPINDCVDSPDKFLPDQVAGRTEGDSQSHIWTNHDQGCVYKAVYEIRRIDGETGWAVVNFSFKYQGHGSDEGK